jgi:ParB/RepB/Spo0J family partition protein
MANSQASTVVPSASVSAVPLARIVIEEGFNPRAEIDPLEQRKLEHSIEQRGILQPVLVDPQDGGDYVLVDGHRRIEAAAKLGLMEIPISIRSSREDGDNLIDAVVANQLHAHLNPLEEALACRRLIDTRLSRKEVAAKLEMTQVTVKERLAILDLPEDLWPKVANGAIPLLAVKALVQVAGIHHDLARSAVAAVLDANVDKEEAHTWAEVAKSPLAVAVDHSESLPEGVFRSDLAYPLESFSISEKAAADLAAYTKLSGRELTVVRFDHEDVEQACLLGAAHDFDWGWLIVGQDVGDRLIEDGAAKALKQERARQRRIRQEDKARETTAGEQDAGEEQPARPESAAEREWRSEREAKAQRKGEQEERERAIQYNLDLGVLALRHLLKIKVDEQVLRILASVHVAGDLRGLASRGARLALPGWPTQTRQRNGKLKTTYLDPAEAEQRATVFLQDAEGPSDIAGRSLTLLALASLADEDAIARTRRSAYGLSFKGPWARQAERDLHAIIRERIKEGQLPALDEILNRRIAEAEETARYDEEVQAARVRLEQLGDLVDLDDESLEGALEDAVLVWGTYSQKTYQLRDQVNAERERRDASNSREEAVIADPGPEEVLNG